MNIKTMGGLAVLGILIIYLSTYSVGLPLLTEENASLMILFVILTLILFILNDIFKVV